MTRPGKGQFKWGSLLQPGPLAVLRITLLLIPAACVGHVESSGESRDENNIDEPQNGGPSGTGNRSGSLDPEKMGDAPPDLQAVCDPKVAVASAPRVWRLTDKQYENTLNSLLPGGAKGVSNPFAGAESGARFNNFAAAFGMPEAAADILVRASGQFAPAWSQRLAAQHTCVASLNADCAAKVVADAGKQAFRRPLTQVEIDSYAGLVQARKATDGSTLAVQAALEAMLISPNFVFRSEIGAGAPDSSGRTKLTPYEVASAISYTTIDGPPDAALMAAAADGALENADQIRAHVVRLLGNLDANPIASRFVAEYFTYREADAIFKDPERAPYHDAEALMASTDLWVKDLLTDRGSFIENLLTSKTGFVNSKTAETYGLPVPKGTDAEKFVRVDLPAEERAGILTQPSFLVAYSATDATDPILRGKFIAKGFLCSGLPDIPPPQVPPLPDLGPQATMRERLAVHRNAEPACRACHDLMDPLGLGLEAYDDTGRFRTLEQGKPVDATGEIVGSSDQEGPFNGAIELGTRLAKSVTVEQCFVRHTFRFWMGRDELDADVCTVADAFDAYKQGEGDLLDVVASILTSDSFLYRTRTGTQ